MDNTEKHKNDLDQFIKDRHIYQAIPMWFLNEDYTNYNLKESLTIVVREIQKISECEKDYSEISQKNLKTLHLYLSTILHRIKDESL